MWKIVAAKEPRMTSHRQKRWLSIWPGNSSIARKEFKAAGMFAPLNAHYREISSAVRAEQYKTAANYMINFIARCGGIEYYCLDELFKNLSPADQILVWQEISRCYTINFCGINKDAQKELIARKLATPDSFKCMADRNDYDVCLYCGAVVYWTLDTVDYFKKISKPYTVKSFIVAINTLENSRQARLLKHEIELRWPDLSHVPYEVTSILGNKLLECMRNRHFDEEWFNEFDTWGMFLWGLRHFHYNFTTDYDTFCTVCWYFKNATTSEREKNHILSHFPRQRLEEVAEEPIVQEYLASASIVGRRTKVALRSP